jgi:hypothetical protein
VTCAGVVHRDPCGTFKYRAQHLARFAAEAVRALDQQTNHLPLGDEDAEFAQQQHQPRHSGLALMILGQHKRAQSRPEMTIDAGRQWRRDDLAVRSLPTLTLEIHDVSTQHQVLHHEAPMALKRARRRRGELDDPLLVDRQP